MSTLLLIMFPAVYLAALLVLGLAGLRTGQYRIFTIGIGFPILSSVGTFATSKPGPSSLASSRSSRLSAVRCAAMCADGPACFVAFCSASRQQ